MLFSPHVFRESRPVCLTIIYVWLMMTDSNTERLHRFYNTRNMTTTRNVAYNTFDVYFLIIIRFLCKLLSIISQDSKLVSIQYPDEVLRTFPDNSSMYGITIPRTMFLVVGLCLLYVYSLQLPS